MISLRREHDVIDHCSGTSKAQISWTVNQQSTLAAASTVARKFVAENVAMCVKQHSRRSEQLPACQWHRKRRKR